MNKVTMLSTDGSIKEIPLYLKDSMIALGWKIVSPDVAEDLTKKGISYLPNYDQTINKSRMDYSTLNGSEEDTSLDIEVL